MDRLHLQKEQLVSLQLGMIKHIQAKVLQRGWKYFQDGKVSLVSVQPDHVAAEVKGRIEYHVVLHLEQFDKSSCSCTYTHYCQHMSAVFFHIYAEYEKRPELFLHQHQQLRLKKQQARTKRMQSREKRPLEESYASQAEPVSAFDSVQQWHAYLAKRFKNYFTSSFQQVEGFYTAVTEDVLPQSERWPSLPKAFFHLHVLLFVLQQMEAYYLSLRQSYMPTHVEQGSQFVFDRCIKAYIRWIREHKDLPADNELYPFMENTLEFLHEQAFDQTVSLDFWMNLYRWLWWEGLGGEVWREKEKIWIERVSRNGTKQMMRKYHLAVIHFHIMEGSDLKAMKELGQWNDLQLSNSLFYLKRFQEEQQWSRLLDWLNYLFPYVEQRRHKAELNRYCKLWAQLVRHHSPAKEDWNRVMVALLPYSYAYLSDYLLHRTCYVQWIDLQLLMDYSPLQADHLTVKAIETSQPELLLPWYHREIETLITQKKREAYRNAIGLLKKIKRIYIQLAQHARWELYVIQLTDKYARLRAFQEELRKEQLC